LAEAVLVRGRSVTHARAAACSRAARDELV
jgi:hypothetical protein